MPTAGRDAAGDRAGRGPAAVDVAGRAARPAGSAVPAADRGQPHRGGTPADAAGDGRLVLFAADRRRTAAAGPSVGVRRRLRPGCRRGGGGGGSGGRDVLDVADLLGSLVDKSLVVAEQAGAGLRYRLLETIRLFAAERLRVGGHGGGGD